MSPPEEVINEVNQSMVEFFGQNAVLNVGISGIQTMWGKIQLIVGGVFGLYLLLLLITWLNIETKAGCNLPTIVGVKPTNKAKMHRTNVIESWNNKYPK